MGVMVTCCGGCFFNKRNVTCRCVYRLGRDNLWVLIVLPGLTESSCCNHCSMLALAAGAESTGHHNSGFRQVMEVHPVPLYVLFGFVVFCLFFLFRSASFLLLFLNHLLFGITTVSPVTFAHFHTLSHLQVREVVHDFYNSRYATCFAQLEALRPILACDIHLHDHLNTLYRDVRTKALVQYTAPFSSVDLTKMAVAFNTNVG